MAAPVKIKAILLTPRGDGSNGRIADYDLYLSDDANDFGAPVLSGTLRDDRHDANRRVARAQKRALSQNRGQKRAFSARVSHPWRN